MIAVAGAGAMGSGCAVGRPGILSHEAMGRHGLAGAWKPVSYELRYANGETVYPLDREPSGYPMYSADGHMCGAMMSSDTPRFAGDNFQKGNPEDHVTAARTYPSYFGPYEVPGDRMVHRVEISLFPNLVDAARDRNIELTGDWLTLSAPIASRGRRGRVEVHWRRT
jgi:hypothetical protein